jgi:hypothetical protein
MLRNLMLVLILATPLAFAHPTPIPALASPFVHALTFSHVTGNGTTDNRAATNASLTKNPEKTIFFPKQTPYGSTTRSCQSCLPATSTQLPDSAAPNTPLPNLRLEESVLGLHRLATNLASRETQQSQRDPFPSLSVQ